MRRLLYKLLLLSLLMVGGGSAYAQDEGGDGGDGGKAKSNGSSDFKPDKRPPREKGKGDNMGSIGMQNGNFYYDPRAGDEHGKTKLRQQRVRFGQVRDDYLWHEESAGIPSRHCGNLSLLSATRFSLNYHVQLSTYLVQDVVRPALFCKVLWTVLKKHWYFTSRFGLENGAPGMKICQRHELFGVKKEGWTIPAAIELSHEFLASYAFFHDANCSDGSLYLVLTGGLALFGSINFRSCPDLEQLEWHFVANRGETLLGDGFRGRLKLWADWKIGPRWTIHGGPQLHFGGFRKHVAFELQAEAEFFLNALFSLKAGGMMSCANYNNVKHKVGGLPMIDFTWYFGKGDFRGRQLFDQRKIYKSRRSGTVM